MRRTWYLVLFAVLVAVLAAGVYHFRHRAAPANSTAAGCDAPAPPPPPKPSEPKIPDFIEAGCGAAPAGAKPAAAAPPK